MRKDSPPPAATAAMGLTTKHSAIAERIGARIASGAYARKLPGLRDLAGEFGANIKTIRKAIDALAAQRVVEIRHGGGVFVAEGRHLSIGIVGNTVEEFFFDDPYYLPVMKGVMRAIARCGDQFSYQHKANRRYVHLFKNHTSVDGFLVFVPTAPSIRELERLRTHVPFLVVGRTLPGTGLSFVDSDNVADSADAVGRLIEEGHRSIAFLGGDVTSLSPRLRLQGYRQALRKGGIAFDEGLVFVGDFRGPKLAERVKADFGSRPVTAAFCADSPSAERALLLLGDRGRDLGLAVYDDYGERIKRLKRHYWVVEQPLAEIGATAIATLQELISGAVQAPVQTLLRSKLVSRQG